MYCLFNKPNAGIAHASVLGAAQDRCKQAWPLICGRDLVQRYCLVHNRCVLKNLTKDQPSNVMFHCYLFSEEVWMNSLQTAIQNNP